MILRLYFVRLNLSEQLFPHLQMREPLATCFSVRVLLFGTRPDSGVARYVGARGRTQILRPPPSQPPRIRMQNIFSAILKFVGGSRGRSPRKFLTFLASKTLFGAVQGVVLNTILSWL